MQFILSMLICVRAAERKRRGWRDRGEMRYKKGTYLTFHNIARLAGIILVFGKNIKPPAFTIGLSPPSIHPCRAAAPTIHQRGACKTPSLLSLPTTDKKEVYKM